MIKQGVLKVTSTRSGNSSVVNWRVVRIEFDNNCSMTGVCPNNGTISNMLWYYNVDLSDVLTLNAIFNSMADSNEFEWTTPLADALIPDLKFLFGAAIYGRNTDGTAPSGSIFLPRNANNHMLINYGGYLDQDSNTIIYGNNAEVRTRDSFKANNIELGKTSKYVITSYSSGWASYGDTQTPTIRKYGNVVNFYGAFKNTDNITLNTTAVQVCTIPAEYRPDKQINQLSQGSGVNKWLLTINPNGTVAAARYGVNSFESISAGAWLVFNATWIVD